ncbi:MAG TPA: hypothetical protein VFS44_03150 [Gemmatimonadaceae bacterium]|nr:hypothetical protein [Gemmatimonadaceae bacterium]
MLDNLDPRERRIDQPTPASREFPVARPIADREVPLTGRTTPENVHAWLDGELSETAARQGDAVRDVDFWLRIEREVQVRREMKTPVHVMERIMESLPASAPESTPWWRRQLTVSPMIAIAATMGAVAVGAAIGAAAVLRAR